MTGFPIEKSLDVLRIVDKLEKIGKENVVSELEKYSTGHDSPNALLEILSIKGNYIEVLSKIRKLLVNYPSGINGCDSLNEIIDYSIAFGCFESINIELSLARGLDYYTGPVFEISAIGYEDYGSIAGGGRYDELIGLFGGEPTPATGVALGMERIISLLESKGVFQKISFNPKALVIAVTEEAKLEAIEVTQELRKSGINTLFDLLGRNISKQLDYASKKKVKKVLLIGKKELKEHSITVRDMDTGEQAKVRRNDLIDYFKS